ncbi:helix-turn-helix transcriptional regulator [Proteus mirabilis]|uniref:helix-turn-helix transcriptional regulator n=1 Tax=Proteus mirabilis TaxID=584 RepID=UPI000D7DEB6F|nr:helix-turn-helix transcriptional regulator [Proteus mirabilis]AWS54177.1 transcriptional regulator [Proteus mirabilis]ELB1227844.1 helix-turn-helix domain-containing protein [Proteus mirabilis]HEM8840024.1 helix-turn-helix domain-containing protein [Proteus mirabilis]
MTERKRTRPELADFLRTKRQSISPESVGLPGTGRRRTPGLRREEVAALSGVGLTWYTWLEQGRDIGVSSQFLDNLATALHLNSAERQHLYLLSHMREPTETGIVEYQVPDTILKILADFPPEYICYVLNLHWDVLAYNQKADLYFHFSDYCTENRNYLYLLFMDPRYKTRINDWEHTADRLLASFWRDHARAKNDPNIRKLIAKLNCSSPEFKHMWEKHEIYPPCDGVRTLNFAGKNERYEYTSLAFDLEKYNRILVYIPKDK